MDHYKYALTTAWLQFWYGDTDLLWWFDMAADLDAGRVARGVPSISL